jgi:hypothetical protein
MVVTAVRGAGIPLVVTLAGGYAMRVEDTVAFFLAASAFFKRASTRTRS